MARRRAQRAARLIQEEISKIIQRELRDPRIGLITVTGVDVTDDLRYAKVFITVFKEENKEKTLEGLEHAKGFIRREIGQRIKMRFTPEIEFKFDDSAERGARIEEILRKIVTVEAAEKSAEGAEETTESTEINKEEKEGRDG